MNCRGEQRRISIVKEYDVRPIAHLRLLNGQTKRSDAEANLTDTYYIFECTSKSNKEIVKTITCGQGAGKHFFKLLNKESLPLFNPLKSVGVHGGDGNEYSRGESKKQKWNETAKQLYNAIQWLIVCWDIVPRGTIIEIRDKVLMYCDREPFRKRIKAINTVISKGRRKRTLTQMINEAREKNDIKDYDFSLLTSKLDGEKSWF